MSTSHRGQPFALWLDQPRCLLSAAANRSSSSSARKRQQTKSMRVQSTRVRAVGGAERHRAPAHLRPAAACRPLPVHLAAPRRACRRRCYAATHIPLYCHGKAGRHSVAVSQRDCHTVSRSAYHTANPHPRPRPRMQPGGAPCLPDPAPPLYRPRPAAAPPVTAPAAQPA